MHELRKDYIFDRWVIVNTERAKRPQDFMRQHPKISEGNACPFCPGSEHLTPPEITRVEEKGRWVLRCFPNRFPAVSLKENPALKTSKDGFFTSCGAFGKHEVIVETPVHGEQFSDLGVERIAQWLRLVAGRVAELRKMKGIGYAAVFKNHGLEAGTSLSHEHTQIIAYNKVPGNVARECEAIAKYRRKRGKCPYCEIVSLERKGPRLIAENSGFVAFTPYASIFEFEAGIFSKRHINGFSEIKEKEFPELAALLKTLLSRLHELDAPYNIYFHEAPRGCVQHFHVKIVPRFITWGGFEHCTGCVINTVSPEQAAEFYRGK